MISLQQCVAFNSSTIFHVSALEVRFVRTYFLWRVQWRSTQVCYATKQINGAE